MPECEIAPGRNTDFDGEVPRTGFEEEDGSRGRFEGLFTGLGPSLRPTGPQPEQ